HRQLVNGHPSPEQVGVFLDADIGVLTKPAHFGLNANPARHLQISVCAEPIEPVWAGSRNPAAGIVGLESRRESAGGKRHLSSISRGRNLRMRTDTRGATQKGKKKQRNSSHGKGAIHSCGNCGCESKENALIRNSKSH